MLVCLRYCRTNFHRIHCLEKEMINYGTRIGVPPWFPTVSSDSEKKTMECPSAAIIFEVRVLKSV